MFIYVTQGADSVDTLLSQIAKALATYSYIELILDSYFCQVLSHELYS